MSDFDVDFDIDYEFEKFKNKVFDVIECIYVENLIYKSCGSRIKYLMKMFPNIKKQLLIDVLSFVLNKEFREAMDELDNFIINNL